MSIHIHTSSYLDAYVDHCLLDSSVFRAWIRRDDQTYEGVEGLSREASKLETNLFQII